MKLPDSMNRKAIMLTFDRLEPVTWEDAFERENYNGLHKHRLPVQPKDFTRRVYYDTEGIKLWLIREGHYRADEFSENPRFGGERLAMRA